MRRWLIFLMIVVGPPADGGAEDGGLRQVRRVLDPGTVLLEGSAAVRLAGVYVPPAQAPAAARALVAWLERGREVVLAAQGAPIDRYGRKVTSVMGKAGRPLAEMLVADGLALVWPSAGTPADHTGLLALEEQAREARLGLWAGADPPFARAGEAGRLVGRYGVVEGRIRDVGSTDHHVYFNFGTDWRSDFTLRVRRPELEAVMGRSLRDVEETAGRRVQARGLIVQAGGPLIEISHPAQIEVLP